jgi:multiple sugar transport system substrate-binding protein
MKAKAVIRHRQLILMLGVIMLLAIGSTSYGQTLHVWVWHNDTPYKAQLEWYKQENPGFTYDLNLIAGSQGAFTEKLILAIAGGSPPDLTWLEGSTVIELAAQGLLTDVTRVLDGIRFTPADVQEMTYQGKMWAVPYFTTSRGLGKRVDLFHQVGLDPNKDPASLEQLFEWNHKLTKTKSDGTYEQVGIVPWAGNWGPPGWIWAFGGRLLDETGLRPTATRPQNIAAFEWIRGWAQHYGGVTPVSGGRDGLLRGTVAMTTVSTSDVGWLLGQNAEVAAGRVPHAPGGGNGTWGGGQAFGIPANATSKDLAMRVLRYLGSESVQLRRFEHFPTVFPANWSALARVVRTLPPLYSTLLDQLPEARPRTPLWIDYYVNQLNPAMTAVVRGNKTPTQALHDVQLVMEERYAQVFGR